MSRANRLLAGVVLTVLCLHALALAQEVSRGTRPAAAPPGDADTLRALALEFYTAQMHNDLEGLAKLWSAKLPVEADRGPALKKSLADTDRTEIKGLSVRAVKVEGDEARVRVDVELSGAGAKEPTAGARPGPMKRALRCVREAGAWKVWGESSAFEELAARLVKAGADGERESLLAEDDELLTRELRRALIGRAIQFYNQGDYSQSLVINSLAQKVAERIGDRAGIAAALTNIGIVHYDQGNYEEALRCYNESQGIWKGLGRQDYIADTLNKLGAVYERQGKYSLALEHFENGLKLREGLGNNSWLAESLHNIAGIRSLQGDYGLALDYFNRSLALREAMPADSANRFAIAQTFHDMGLVYEAQGNYAKALGYYDRSLQLKKGAGIELGIESTLNNIGQIHEWQGNYRLALEYYLESLKLSQRFGNKALHAQALGSIGRVYELQGDYESALKQHQESLALARGIGHRALEARALKRIGAVHGARRDYAPALDYYGKSLEIEEALLDRSGIAETLNSIAAIHFERQDYAQAARVAERATDIARQIGGRDALWRGHTVAGQAYRALNQPSLARRAFEEAVATVETMREDVAGGEQQRQGFFEDKVSPYHGMLELLIAGGDPGAALSYAERAKARVLLDVLQSGRANVAKAMTPEELGRERALRSEAVSLNKQVALEGMRSRPDAARLAELSARLEKSRLDYEAFRASIYTKHPGLRAQRGEAQPLKLEEAGALLAGTNSALLEFVVTDGKTFLFVLTRGGARGALELKQYPLEIGQQDLRERVRNFRQRLASRDLNFRDPARRLYELLLKPAEGQLQGRGALVIVPDGPLWELPFQALQPAAGRYLLEEFAISYAPSLTMLREVARLRKESAGQGRGPETLLAFGDPAGGPDADAPAAGRDEKLSALPESGREVNALGRLYGTARSRVYTGPEAREERLKQEAGGYRILHLATHGLFNDTSPMYSQVVLSRPRPDDREDGLLEAWEIMNLDLKADLVVLSACETARGRVGAGEGMIGLTWALFVAGTPAAVVSQWKVESTSTTELMLEFHRRFKAPSARPGGSNRAAWALRQSALKLMGHPEYRHPYYWAGFVVVGDGG